MNFKNIERDTQKASENDRRRQRRYKYLWLHRHLLIYTETDAHTDAYTDADADVDADTDIADRDWDAAPNQIDVVGVLQRNVQCAFFQC